MRVQVIIMITGPVFCRYMSVFCTLLFEVCCFWVTNHQKHAVLTKFGRNLPYWTDDVKSAANKKLQITGQLTEKTWGWVFEVMAEHQTIGGWNNNQSESVKWRLLALMTTTNRRTDREQHTRSKCCECPVIYIGETGRNRSTRLTEGKWATKKMASSTTTLLNTIYSQVAKGSDLYRADKSTKLCMVVA